MKKLKEITPEIKVILNALCGVITQYMPREIIDSNKEGFEHACMSAGQDAAAVLIEYGLAEDDGWNIVPNEKFWGIV